MHSPAHASPRYILSFWMRAFPRHVRSSRHTFGKLPTSERARCRAGREPNSSSSLRAIFSEMDGMHLSWRSKHVSRSLSLLRFDVCGGHKPGGSPGVLPAFCIKCFRTAAVSSTSSVRSTCELGRNSALTHAPSKLSCARLVPRKSPSTRKKMLQQEAWSLASCSPHRPVLMDAERSSAVFRSAIHELPFSYSHRTSPTGSAATL